MAIFDTDISKKKIQASHSKIHESSLSNWIIRVSSEYIRKK